MTKEELAAKLNGREYREEITDAEEAEAKASNLLVIFGASDDLCELRGAIHDEVDAVNEVAICVGKDGELIPEIDEIDQEVLEKFGLMDQVFSARESALRVDAEYGACWKIETKTPHAKFSILEDGNLYCRGIVLDLKS